MLNRHEKAPSGRLGGIGELSLLNHCNYNSNLYHEKNRFIYNMYLFGHLS